MNGDIAKARRKVSVMFDLSQAKRNDIEGAVAVWRKALKLREDGRLRDHMGDVAENLLMLQDRPDKLLRRLAETERAFK